MRPDHGGGPDAATWAVAFGLLAVAERLRGQGMGGRLLAFALEQASVMGINTLHLEVEGRNAGAKRLYRAAGFGETGRRLMRRRILPIAAS